MDITPAVAWALVTEANKGREQARRIYMDRTASPIARELAAKRWLALGEGIALITKHVA